jgi:glycine/D-amino acid oxidase-like deaminating enzyme
MQTTRPLPLQGFGNGIVVVLPRVVKGEFIVGSPGIPHLKQDHWGTALSEDHKMELLEGALEMNPDLEDAKIVEYRGDLQGWAPTHPHMKPVMGRIPEWENGYTAFRFGTLGMCQSAGVGRIMAQMIDTGKRPVNHVKMLESLDPVHG